MSARISLRIDELVLHGVAPTGRHRIGVALQCELARLFAEQGVPGRFQASLSLERLAAAELSLPTDASPEQVGIRIAQALYAGLAMPEVGAGRAQGER